MISIGKSIFMKIINNKWNCQQAKTQVLNVLFRSNNVFIDHSLMLPSSISILIIFLLNSSNLKSMGSSTALAQKELYFQQCLWIYLVSSLSCSIFQGFQTGFFLALITNVRTTLETSACNTCNLHSTMLVLQ